MREGIYYQYDQITIICRPITWPISLAANKLSPLLLPIRSYLIFSYFPHSFHLEKNIPVKIELANNNLYLSVLNLVNA